MGLDGDVLHSLPAALLSQAFQLAGPGGIVAHQRPIRVCLLGKEFGIADAIARALDSGFETRHRNDLNLKQWTDWQEWCDVILLNMRDGCTNEDSSEGIRIIDEVQQSLCRPP